MPTFIIASTINSTDFLMHEVQLRIPSYLYIITIGNFIAVIMASSYMDQ